MGFVQGENSFVGPHRRDEAQHIAKAWLRWKQIVDVLYPTRDEEDYVRK